MANTSPRPLYPLLRAVTNGTNWKKRIPKSTTFTISPQIQTLLSQPTWSVKSLLPPSDNSSGPQYNASTDSRGGKTNSQISNRQVNSHSSPSAFSNNADLDGENKEPTQKKEDEEITPEKLRHLLRLSALPAPRTKQEERDMIETLKTQIHFVKEMQKVDTRGVTPLVAIRDETEEARQENMITLADLQQTLDEEVKVGRNGTVRRRKPEEMVREARDVGYVGDKSGEQMSRGSGDGSSSDTGDVDADAQRFKKDFEAAVAEPEQSNPPKNETTAPNAYSEETQAQAQQIEQDSLDAQGRYLDSMSEEDFVRIQVGEPWKIDPFSLGGEVEKRTAGRYFVVKKRKSRPG